MHSIDRSQVGPPDARAYGERRRAVPEAVAALDGVLLGGLSLLVSRFAAGPAAVHDVMIAGSGAALLVYGRGRRRWENAAPFLGDSTVQCRAVMVAMSLGAAATTVALMLMSWPVMRALPFSAMWLAGGTVLLGLGRLAITFQGASRLTRGRPA